MNPEIPYNQLPKLPPSEEIESPEILKKAVVAHRALAQLKGLGPLIPNQVLLLQLLGLQEAKLSSEIENIVTTHDQLYLAFADRLTSITAETKEVLRYKDALWFGYEAIRGNKRFLNTPLFEEIATKVLGREVEIRKLPGTKLSDGWGNTIYTPPQGEERLWDLLKNIETFIYEEQKGLDPLIKLALIHYQFEAIHPFYDGNGRTGRILNILFLIEKKILEFPILYHSQYIIQRKAEYYGLLRGVTERKEWGPWIQFILDALIETAMGTEAKIRKIRSVMKETGEKIANQLPKIYSEELLQTLFEHPYCKIKFLEKAQIAKRQTASQYLNKLVEIGVLECVRHGKEKYFLNKAFIKALTG